jgi:hypothetical protein
MNQNPPQSWYDPSEARTSWQSHDVGFAHTSSGRSPDDPSEARTSWRQSRHDQQNNQFLRDQGKGWSQTKIDRAEIPQSSRDKVNENFYNSTQDSSYGITYPYNQSRSTYNPPGMRW